MKVFALTTIESRKMLHHHSSLCRFLVQSCERHVSDNCTCCWLLGLKCNFTQGWLTLETNLTCSLISLNRRGRAAASPATHCLSTLVSGDSFLKLMCLAFVYSHILSIQLMFSQIFRKLQIDVFLICLSHFFGSCKLICLSFVYHIFGRCKLMCFSFVSRILEVANLTINFMCRSFDFHIFGSCKLMCVSFVSYSFWYSGSWKFWHMQKNEKKEKMKKKKKMR